MSTTSTLPNLSHGEKPRVEVWNVHQLLSNTVLRIPDYQRPYAWNTRNVAELVEDIRQFTTSGSYRIGTIILHNHHDRGSWVLDVVDGQQRLTTMHLLARVLQRSGHDPVPRQVAPLRTSPYGLDQTVEHVHANYDYLTRVVDDWGAGDVQSFAEVFFLQCEVVVVTLASHDEAFQMFDSQNARGRALYPTDLLKAFHLREIGAGLRDDVTKREVVELWEDIPARHVNALFNEYLFKIRRWASGRSVPRAGFTTNDIGAFKGIRESDASNNENHWARPFVYAKNLTDDFRAENSTLVRFGMLQALEYPHQIDHPILNGETFFRMVAHYYALGVRLGLLAFDNDLLSKERRAVMGQLRSPVLEPIDRQHERGGDRSRYAYVRGLLDALILYHHDRFGNQERERFAGLAARYVMVPRSAQFAVKRETVDKYALGDSVSQLNLFQEVRDARSAREVVNREVARPVLYRPERPNETDRKVVALLWSHQREVVR